ncbi:MAG: hypothetical protein ABI678_03845 [Kofleriaceae bacterium]
MRWLVILALAACAPAVPTPAERAAASDRSVAVALERQLIAIPGVTTAHAAIHSAFRDPLTGAATPAAASVLLTTAPGADRATIEATTHRLAPAATLALVPGPAPASPSSSKPLAIAALLLILGAAGFVAWRTRPTA